MRLGKGAGWRFCLWWCQVSKTERASAVEEGREPEEEKWKRAGLTCGKASRSSRALVSGNEEEEEESRETACSRTVHPRGRKGRQTRGEIEVCQLSCCVGG